MRPLTFLISAGLLLSLLVGAGGAETAPTAAEPVNIVAFGDSTTASRGETMIYAAILPEELRHVRMINAGVPGNTTVMARQRFDADVLSHQPRIAIIQFGINDATVDVWKKPPATAPRVALARYEANLRYFVQTLKSRNALVVLMTPNPLRWTPKLKELYGRPPYRPEEPEGLNGPLAPYCEAVRRVAREEGAALIDVQQAFPDHASKQGISVDALLLDGMHPNDPGHRLVADLLIARLLATAQDHHLPITAAPRPEILTAIPAEGEFRQNSYPVIAALPDERLFLTWAAGTVQMPKTRIVGAFSQDGGRHWDQPETIINSPLGDCDPAVILTPDEIQVYSTSRPGPIIYTESWKSTCKYHDSHWSPAVKMPAHHKYEVGKNHIGMTMADGTLLMPYSWDVLLEAGKTVDDSEGNMKLKSGVLRSHDGGQTWTPGGDMFVDIPQAQKKSTYATNGVCEPAMVLLSNGEIFALLRTSDSCHYQSRSRDGGLTWDTPTPSPLAGHNSPSALYRLRDSGDVLVVWDHSPKSRWPLTAALSKDGCHTWSKPRTLINTPGFPSAYPSATQLPDGTLVAVWFQMLPGKGREIRLARFTREWLEGE